MSFSRTHRPTRGSGLPQISSNVCGSAASAFSWSRQCAEQADLFCVDELYPVRGSGAQQGLDGAALVHRAVSLCGLVEGRVRSNTMPGSVVCGAVLDEADQLGQEAADSGAAAVRGGLSVTAGLSPPVVRRPVFGSRAPRSWGLVDPLGARTGPRRF